MRAGLSYAAGTGIIACPSSKRVWSSMPKPRSTLQFVCPARSDTVARALERASEKARDGNQVCARTDAYLELWTGVRLRCSAPKGLLVARPLICFDKEGTDISCLLDANDVLLNINIDL